MKRRRPQERACSVAVDTADPALPVAGTGKLSAVRKSKRSRWRAATLLGVHLLAAAHVTHFLVAGRTVSPVEPSEAMYTLELGYVNAGFIFLLVALAATLIFGRFFCGWGCHVVALQDLCGWVMKRLGIRPRPFRSRLLLWVPLALALYMFVWPTFKRMAAPAVDGRDLGPLQLFVDWLFEEVPRNFAGFSNHLMTEGFWTTFPGPVFAVLTFGVCGFAAVYFLGAKGFCSYGCPYGGLFAVVDRWAPGRIRVTDDCEQCGHCSATCTSNVRVHEEVALYGMVVDPGCMKCMDCVSVCPKGALYFGFGAPAVAARRPAYQPTRVFTLSTGQELYLIAVFLFVSLSFRGLYDGPPLLMSVGLGGISAFLTYKLVQLVRRPTVRIQNLNLKLGGATRPSGWIFAGLTVAWLAFGAHSAFAQWHRGWGAYQLGRTESTQTDVFGGGATGKSYSATHHRAAARAHRHFELADRWGLVAVPEVKLGLAWTHLLRDEPEPAEVLVRSLVESQPDSAQQLHNLFQIQVHRGRLAEAAATLERKMELLQAGAEDHFVLAGLLVQSGRYQDALRHYRACVEQAPQSLQPRYDLGALLRRLGRTDEAVLELELARRLAPQDVEVLGELALAQATLGNTGAARETLRQAAELAPDDIAIRELIEQIDSMN